MKNPHHVTTDLSDIRNLIFAPAGITGICYGGALSVLEQEGALHKLENVAGGSSGAIAAWMVALGYSGEEIKTLLKEKDFSEFGSWSLRENIKYVSRKLEKSTTGLFSGEKLRNWGKELALIKTGQPNITFKEFDEMQQKANDPKSLPYFVEIVKRALSKKSKYCQMLGLDETTFRYAFEVERYQFNENGNFDKIENRGFFETDDNYYRRAAKALQNIAKQFKSVHFIAAEVKNPKEYENLDNRYGRAVLDAEHTPELMVAHGMRLSASYPFVFRNGRIHAKYQNPPFHDIADSKKGFRRYTDGALIDPIPVSLFEEEGKPKQQTLIMDTGHLTQEAVRPASQEFLFEVFRRCWPGDHVDNVVRHFNKQFEKAYEVKHVEDRTLMIDRLHVMATDFFIPDETQDKLYHNGAAAMETAFEYFKQAEPEKYAALQRHNQRSDPNRSGFVRA